MGPIGPEVDPKAIYVGDLPLYINEQRLRYKFGYFGWIVNVEVRRLVRSKLLPLLDCHPLLTKSQEGSRLPTSTSPKTGPQPWLLQTL